MPFCLVVFPFPLLVLVTIIWEKQAINYSTPSTKKKKVKSLQHKAFWYRKKTNCSELRFETRAYFQLRLFLIEWFNKKTFCWNIMHDIILWGRMSVILAKYVGYNFTCLKMLALIESGVFWGAENVFMNIFHHCQSCFSNILQKKYEKAGAVSCSLFPTKYRYPVLWHILYSLLCRFPFSF
jgi:hypothetical protein